MINFHKYAFLDCKKLKRLLEKEEYWLCQYNPIWLFVWSDYYKPEISFRQDFCFIRFMMPEVGMCYYPPIGNGDLKKAYLEMQQDAKENGFEFIVGPVDEQKVSQIQKLGDKLFENPNFATYIYSSDKLSFFKGKEYKDKRKSYERFEKMHPNAVYKPIKKEDFPMVLEFMTVWNEQNKEKYNTPFFYRQLNMIKKCMDHLYELDLFGVLLLDEKQVYGFSIASIVGNVATIHINLALTDVEGAYEELVQCFARTSMLKARYISFEDDMGDLEQRKLKQSYKPIKVEKYFASFKL